MTRECPTPLRCNRGYFEIGIYRPQHGCNVGTLLRSAYQLGAAGVFIIGPRYKRQASDTTHTEFHVPLREYPSWEAFMAGRPRGAELVAVESPEYGGRWLSEFTHPLRGQYLLGSESTGLPAEVVKQCHHVVSIEALRQPSYNVAVAGSLVMWHRLASRGTKI